MDRTARAPTVATMLFARYLLTRWHERWPITLARAFGPGPPVWRPGGVPASQPLMDGSPRLIPPYGPLSPRMCLGRRSTFGLNGAPSPGGRL